MKMHGVGFVVDAWWLFKKIENSKFESKKDKSELAEKCSSHTFWVWIL